MSVDRYVTGVGGIPNYGDEFINRTWLEYLNERYPGDCVVSCTGKPSTVSALQRGSHDSLLTSSLFADLVFRSGRRASSFSDRAAWITEKLENRGTPEWDIAISQFMANCESLHFMGGGYLNADWESRYLLLEIAATLKGRSGAKVFGTGLGLTPFADPLRPWISDRIAVFDFVEARDSESANAAGVGLGLDDAWLAFRKGMDCVQRVASPPPYMINIQKDYSGEYIEQMVAAGVEAIISDPGYNEHAVVGVAEAFPSKDGWLFSRLKKSLPNPIEFFTFQRLWEQGLPANPDTVWITTRFHFHLLASALGSRGVVLAGGSEFYSVKHRSLLELGTGWNFVDVSQPGQMQSLNATRSDDFDDVVVELAKRKLETANSLYPIDDGAEQGSSLQRSVTTFEYVSDDPFIGVVTHKDCEVPSDPAYSAVAVGDGKRNVTISGNDSLFYDDSGVNITHKNSGYCELTALYWMWKNVRSPIKGLVHYRRFLKGVGSDSVISGGEVKLLLKQYDVLLPYRWIVEGSGLSSIPKTVANQYGRAHSPGDLLDLLDVIHGVAPSYSDPFLSVMRSDRFYLGNIAIMREDTFDAYCGWLFPILSEFERSHPISDYRTSYQRRVYGFLAERLLSVWLEGNPSLRRRSLGMHRV